VTPPLSDEGSGVIMLLKNWVPKMLPTVDIGRNIIAKTDSILTI
jgi:hypothetical protein